MERGRERHRNRERERRREEQGIEKEWKKKEKRRRRRKKEGKKRKKERKEKKEEGKEGGWSAMAGGHWRRPELAGVGRRPVAQAICGGCKSSSNGENGVLEMVFRRATSRSVGKSTPRRGRWRGWW